MCLCQRAEMQSAVWWKEKHIAGCALTHWKKRQDFRVGANIQNIMWHCKKSLKHDTRTRPCSLCLLLSRKINNLVHYDVEHECNRNLEVYFGCYMFYVELPEGICRISFYYMLPSGGLPSNQYSEWGHQVWGRDSNPDRSKWREPLQIFTL